MNLLKVGINHLEIKTLFGIDLPPVTKKLENWKSSTNTNRYIEALRNKDSLKSREWIISNKGGLEFGGGTKGKYA